ncbi:MAG: V-type ATP synthase subunit K [Oscillospiraceae bacterium]|nr:V-type ATP synthase subunit K [Oscillospiraceae bacterium]
MSFQNLFSAIFSGYTFALLGAALAIGLAGSGSAKGVGIAGEAGTGIISTSPEQFGRVLLLQALPGTQGIYGLLVAFLILFSDPVSSGTLTIAQGIGYFCSALPIAIAGYFSAIAQGRVSAASMGIIASKPEESMKGVIAAGLVETYAVLALLISVLILFNVPTMLP